MQFTHTLGHEELDDLADQLVAAVAEQPFGLGVHERDAAVGSDAQHRVGCGLEQAPELRVGPVALAEVADGRRDQDPITRRHRRQRDLGRELAAVAPAPGELYPRSHRASPPVPLVPGTVRRVYRPRTLGDEHLDRLSDQLLARVPEERFDLRIREDDATPVVDGDDPVRCRLEQARDRLIDRLYDRQTPSSPHPARQWRTEHGR